MGTGNILLGGNPAMDLVTCPGKSSNTPMHETGISPGRLGLWPMCAFTLPFFVSNKIAIFSSNDFLFFKYLGILGKVHSHHLHGLFFHILASDLSIFSLHIPVVSLFKTIA